MMTKRDFAFPSKDGVHEIHAVEYRDESVEAIGVLQLIHGMAEYIERYVKVAEYFTARGYIVVGDDHLGHGLTAKEKSDYGYFAPQHGDDFIVDDEISLTKLIAEKYPELPYYVLGHSMGSFILRNYLCKNQTKIQGAIICGTGDQPEVTLLAGKMLAGIMKLFGMERKPNAFLDKIGFGAYNKKTEKRTAFDWLCTDESVVDAYLADPLCGFLFTTNGFATMFELIHKLHNRAYLAQMDKQLPILFIAGTDDPVGNYGAAVQSVYKLFQDLSMADVDIKLYDGMRHEILNETEKEKVFQDVYQWMTK